MYNPNYFIPDFVEIQRQGFFYLLEKGIVEEINKRNPITNYEKQIEIYFYPEYYRLTKPFYSLQQAIFFKKSYVSKLYIPVQLTDRKNKRVFLKWMLFAHFPLMTNRGHFVLNGSARVIINQLVRSPGIYFRENIHEIYSSKWSEKPSASFRRFYADIICLKGTWLRIECEKDFSMWAKLKKGPKVPLLWFLLGMGLTEKYILNSVYKPMNLFESFTKEMEKIQNSQKEFKYPYVSTSHKAWEQIQKLLKLKTTILTKQNQSNLYNSNNSYSNETKNNLVRSPGILDKQIFEKSYKKKNSQLESYELGRKWFYNKFMNPRTYDLGKQGRWAINKKLGLMVPIEQTTLTAIDLLTTTDFLMRIEDGNFVAIDDIDNLKNKRVRSSGESLQEILNIGLIRLEKSIRLKLNLFPFKQTIPRLQRSGVLRPLRCVPQARVLAFACARPASQRSGRSKPSSKATAERSKQRSKHSTAELRNACKQLSKRKQLQRSKQTIHSAPSLRLLRLFASLRNTFFKRSKPAERSKLALLALRSKQREQRRQSKAVQSHSFVAIRGNRARLLILNRGASNASEAANASKQRTQIKIQTKINQPNSSRIGFDKKTQTNFLNSFISTRPINGAFREFFGTHPLSQFMDQINPLSEITHKRRLSSLGPGGVSRDTATLAIRGIHPSHYGRICPIETPEGKNTGLVNSITTYAKLSFFGFLESPFFKVYKGQVQQNLGVFFLSPDKEEYLKIGTPDLNLTKLGFLPKNSLPVRVSTQTGQTGQTGTRFVRMKSNKLALMGVSPLQMISVATSFIPFLEHDDANRALMGSNMLRQAVPLIRMERPILGTGLESRVVSDSGHSIISKTSGYVMYSSGTKIYVYTF